MEGRSPKEEILLFTPFSSTIDVGFWHQLCQRKLLEFKLDDSAREIEGSYVNDHPAGISSRFSVDYDAFQCSRTYSHAFRVKGWLYNKNTIEDFKQCDKKQLIQMLGNQIWEDIKSKKAIDDPACLNCFGLLTYADLKKYHFYYWFAFPALTPEHNICVESVKPVSEVLTERQMTAVEIGYLKRAQGNSKGQQVFLLKCDGEEVVIGDLKEWEQFYSGKNTEHCKTLLAFADPSTLETNPGWPLRNLLALVGHHWGSTLDKLEVLCYRDRVRGGSRDTSHSIVISVTNLTSFSSRSECPNVVGWEKNSKQKMAPMSVNLSSTMDPIKLAESAVDLNLKLMRWRLVPDIDLDIIASTRCLLLGSGTLGCNVARSLMGWGFKKITFVDNAKVSYSNPVRQSLFQFEDCIGGGKRKAEAASEALRRIFPGMDASFCEMSIPMPGHPVAESETEQNRIREEVERLEQLIDSHDVLFLLMDTRESRWLPSVIGTTKHKIIINAALGFDTFMVMRHGMKPASSEEVSVPATTNVSTDMIPGDKLGCYFCSDVVAPGNSTRDRTLDQQCTVSRPGISMMASALAVELLVSILQHPKKGLAAAATSAKDAHLDAAFETPLGLVPHQIRGFMSRFQVVMPACLSFDKCTACSAKVLSEYQSNGFEFLLKVFNVPQYLEEITGLVELQRMTSSSEIWELSDDDDDEEA